MSDTSTDFGSLFSDFTQPTPSFDTGSSSTPSSTSSLSQGLDLSFPSASIPQLTSPSFGLADPSINPGLAQQSSVTPQSGGFFDTMGTQLSNYFSNPANVLKAGVGLGGLGLGLFEQSQAGAQGAAAQKELGQIPKNLMDLSRATQDQLNQISQQYQSMVNQASQAMQGMSQPMMQQYSQLLTLTNQGSLTPANRQIYEAAQAQLAQNYANQGAVGAEQGQTQLSDLYQRLLASQMQQALQLFQTASPGMVSGIETGLTGAQQAAGYQISGLQTALNAANIQDSYLAQAIQLGLQNDAQARQQLGEFTGAIGKIVGG